MKVLSIFAKFFTTRSQRARTKRVVRQAVAPMMEPLGEIVLLSATYEYDVPAGHSAVYLEKVTATPGAVNVFLDNPITGTLGHQFTDPTGLDIIRSADTGAKLVDQVPAAFKPSGGIQYEGSNGNTLELDAGATDQQIDIGGPDPTNNNVPNPRLILLTDASDPNNILTGLDRIGGAITTLKIVTNSNIAGTADGGATVHVFSIERKIGS